jgi:hypothetical protein
MPGQQPSQSLSVKGDIMRRGKLEQKSKRRKATRDRLLPQDKHKSKSWEKRNKSREKLQTAYAEQQKLILQAQESGL